MSDDLDVAGELATGRPRDASDADTGRLEAFSDGVLAIVITLLVLGIEVPPSARALGPELLALWPSYLAYGVSFLLIGAIWVNHHAMFRHIARADGPLLVLNLLHLGRRVHAVLDSSPRSGVPYRHRLAHRGGVLRRCARRGWRLRERDVALCGPRAPPA